MKYRLLTFLTIQAIVLSAQTQIDIHKIKGSVGGGVLTGPLTNLQLVSAIGGGGTYAAITYGSTITFPAVTNTTGAYYWTVTLTGTPSTVTLTGTTAGQSYYFSVCQDSTGGRTWTWPTQLASVADPVLTTASQCTYENFWWDGTNPHRIGSTTVKSGPPQVPESLCSSAPTPATGYSVLCFDSSHNLGTKDSAASVHSYSGVGGTVRENDTQFPALYIDASGAYGWNPNFFILSGQSTLVQPYGISGWQGMLAISAPVSGSSSSSNPTWYRRMRLPTTWTSTIDDEVLWIDNNVGSGNVTFRFQTACQSVGASTLTGPPTFTNTPSVVVAASGSGSAMPISTKASGIATGSCGAGDLLFIQVQRLTSSSSEQNNVVRVVADTLSYSH